MCCAASARTVSAARSCPPKSARHGIRTSSCGATRDNAPAGLSLALHVPACTTTHGCNNGTELPSCQATHTIHTRHELCCASHGFEAAFRPLSGTPGNRQRILLFDAIARANSKPRDKRRSTAPSVGPAHALCQLVPTRLRRRHGTIAALTPATYPCPMPVGANPGRNKRRARCPATRPTLPGMH